MRLWIGPVGELLGTQSDGTPVVSDGDGVEPMREISGMVEGFTISDSTVTPLRRGPFVEGVTTVRIVPDFPTVLEWQPMTFEEGDDA